MSALGSITARPRFAMERDALLAAVLAVAGLVEVLATPSGMGDRAVSAVAVVCATVPLAWRRTRPLLPVAALTLALIVQEALGGFLVGHTATLVIAIAFALYSAGRHVPSARGLAAAAAGVIVLSAVRIASDPAVDDAAPAVLTVVAVSLPLLVGRWARGQALLQGALARRAAKLERDRERAARHAAETERMRIAGDLQAAVAGGLREIVANAEALPDHLRAGDHTAARGLLARSSITAREALADVRRVLGILRREGQTRRLDPPADPAIVLDRPAPAAADHVGGLAPRGDAPALAPATADRLLAAVVLVGVELELAFVALTGEWPVAALAGVLIAAPLLWRRRYPRLAFAGVLSAVALQSALLDLATFPCPTSPRSCARRTRSRRTPSAVRRSSGSCSRSPARARTRRSSIRRASWRRCSAACLRRGRSAASSARTVGLPARAVRRRRALSASAFERRRPPSRASGCGSRASCTTRSPTTSA